MKPDALYYCPCCTSGFSEGEARKWGLRMQMIKCQQCGNQQFMYVNRPLRKPYGLWDDSAAVDIEIDGAADIQNLIKMLKNLLSNTPRSEILDRLKADEMKWSFDVMSRNDADELVARAEAHDLRTTVTESSA